MKKQIFTTLFAGVILATCSQKPTVNAQNENVKADEAVETEVVKDNTEENAAAGKDDSNAGYEVRIKNSGDSTKIVQLLKEGANLPSDENVTLFYARKFLGYPYVGGTLDVDMEEGLIINTKELDCTTFVENVLALSICSKRGQTSFQDFCNALVQVRYIGGEVSYTKDNTISPFGLRITLTMGSSKISNCLMLRCRQSALLMSTT